MSEISKTQSNTFIDLSNIAKALSDSTVGGLNFADMLKEAIDKDDGVKSTIVIDKTYDNIKPDGLKPFFSPETVMSIITPFTNRCKLCNKVIASGDYCPLCAKKVSLMKNKISDVCSKNIKGKA